VYEAFLAEITRLGVWVKAANLAEERQVLWCLARLPDAFRELSRTYESRYADDIARYQQAALSRLTEGIGPAAGLLADKLRGKIQSLNERYGLPRLPDPPPAARTAKTSRIRAPKNPA
jgi:hypothetical protein